MMSMNELNTTARDLMSVRAMIEELEAEAQALTDKLKAVMVEQGTEALESQETAGESTEGQEAAHEPGLTEPAFEAGAKPGTAVGGASEEP